MADDIPFPPAPEPWEHDAAVTTGVNMDSLSPPGLRCLELALLGRAGRESWGLEEEDDGSELGVMLRTISRARTFVTSPRPGFCGTAGTV